MTILPALMQVNRLRLSAGSRHLHPWTCQVSATLTLEREPSRQELDSSHHVAWLAYQQGIGHRAAASSPGPIVEVEILQWRSGCCTPERQDISNSIARFQYAHHYQGPGMRRRYQTASQQLTLPRLEPKRYHRNGKETLITHCALLENYRAAGFYVSRNATDSLVWRADGRHQGPECDTSIAY